jgi:uncharacterized protein YeaO (DUF488 family)
VTDWSSKEIGAVIKVKSLFDAIEPDDGLRLWVEPFGLTRDLREWCQVNHVLPHLGPPTGLWDWFDLHPDGYGFFRASYHEWLGKGKYKPALQELAAAGLRQTFTLIHQSDNGELNTASALHEYLCELQSWVPPKTPE